MGPGIGTLTQELSKKAKRVIAVEKDDRLVEELRAKFASEIAEKKLVDLTASDVESAMKTIEGSARSMGIEVTN